MTSRPSDVATGGSSGRYQVSHPFWYRRRSDKLIHRYGHATDTYSLRANIRPTGLQQQIQSSSIPTTRPSGSQSPSVSPDPTDQHIDTSNDEGNLSQETILKIEELKRRIYGYSQYHHNPGAIINCIVYYCNNGDNTLLDEKLEQLRRIDAISN